MLSQSGQTPLSLADKFGHVSAAALLRDVTNVRPVESLLPSQEDVLIVVKPESMTDPVNFDSDDEAG